MKKIITIGILAGLFVLNSSAQTTSSYYTGFDNPAQQNSWTIFRNGMQGPTIADWELAAYTGPGSEPVSATNQLKHSSTYATPQACDDWYVSPAFDFSGGGRIDSLRYAFSGQNIDQNQELVGIYLLSGAQDPATATATVSLFQFINPISVNDNIWRKLTSIPIPPSAGASYIAFRYKTLNSLLTVRFDNLAVSWYTSVGLDEQASALQPVKVFPNPAGDHAFVSYQTKDGAEVQLYDLSGKLILTSLHSSTGTRINTAALPKGVYTVRIKDKEQSREVEKLIVE